MKKLEKLGSKLFDAFRGDEVSELASIFGGRSVYTKTHEDNGAGCEDTWKSENSNDLLDRSLELNDLMRSELAIDRGTYSAYYGEDFGNSDPLLKIDLTMANFPGSQGVIHLLPL